MQNLINFIQKENKETAVSARELHMFLEIGARFDIWIKRMFEYDFEEFRDFETCSFLNPNNQTVIDYALSLDCAKEISMIQRTEKGKEARRYFIECEKKLKEAIQSQSQIPQTFAEALKLAYEQQITIERLETRTKFVDVVFNSDDLLTGAQVCKLLNLSYGNKTLYKNLREKGLFFKNRNEPKQLFVDKGYFRMKEVLIKDKVRIQTYFTQKGLGYIAKFLGVIIQPINTVRMID